MKKVKIEVMLQGYGDSHFATSVEEIIEVDDNAPIDDLWAKRIYVEEATTTDKLSVEKLQEQLNTAKKALTEISETKVPFRNGCFHWKDFSEDALKAQKALAAIGNEGSGDESC